jgi:hypothetical protein
MADKILHKRNLISNTTPTTASLDIGELAINVADAKIFVKQSGSSGEFVRSILTLDTPNTGSINLLGSITASYLLGTASNATSASYAPVPTGTVSSSQQINTGSFTGSFIGIHSGSLFGTSSWASNAISSSFATTASAATSITFTPPTASFALTASYAPPTFIDNFVTVGLAGSDTNYNSIKAAVNSITDASANNTYTVRVYPGVYIEDTITMKSYVAVKGDSSISTIVSASNPSASIFVMADQSMVIDMQIQGTTATTSSAIIYSSPTTPQTNAIAYVENVRFGTNYTNAKVIGSGSSGNCILQCSNVKYGGFTSGSKSFDVGFYVTSGSDGGIGRMQLRNVTSTNGGIAGTDNDQIFALADAPGCTFIVNGCLLTRSTGTARGTGFKVYNGGQLRLTGVNFQRWITGIWAPQTGSAPSIDAIALNFENCTTDVQIDHSGSLGKVSGTDTFLKTLINKDAPLYEVNQDPRRITVAKKGGDFTSISASVAYITDSAENNRYVIEVGPGEFSEKQIDMRGRPYVAIVGSDIQTSVIVPSGSGTFDQLLIGPTNEVSFLTLKGNNVAGYSAITVQDLGTQFAQVHKISIYNHDYGIKVLANVSSSTFYGEYVDINGPFAYGVYVSSSNTFSSLANIENYYLFPSSSATIGNYAVGPSSSLGLYTGLFQGDSTAGSTAIKIERGATLEAAALDIQSWGYGVRVPSTAPAPNFRLVGTMIHDSVTYDFDVLNTTTKGRFQGVSSHVKINNLSNNFYWNFLDDDDGENDITRALAVTFADGTHTDASTLIFKGSPMGVMQGGIITTGSGFNITVASGFGYVQDAVTPDVYKRIDWVNGNLALTANSNNYIYFTSAEVLTAAGSIPNNETNIILGRVVTNNTTIELIDQVPYNGEHMSNKLSTFNREALGPVYAAGSTVTEDATPFKLDVTAGTYFFSENKFTPVGTSSINLTQYYPSASAWARYTSSVVPSNQYASSSMLVAMSSSAYTKHTLYGVGEGVDEKYFLVINSNQYSSLVSAENADLPSIPTYFNDGVVPLAAVYVQSGSATITQIQDIRPIIGFRAAGVNASSIHGNLLGLSADDHTQYLLVNGARAMAGNLSLGGNNITNVGTMFGTASWASNAISSSFATTASYAVNAIATLPSGLISSSTQVTASLVGTAINPSLVSASTVSASALHVTTLATIKGPLELQNTSRPSPVNANSAYWFVSGANNNFGTDLYYTHNGDTNRMDWFEGMLGSSLLYGGIVSWSAANIYVSSGSGLIVNHNISTGSEASPTITYIQWPSQSAAISGISTRQVTYLYLDNTGTIQQQTTPFTPEQYYQYIPLGAVGHFDYANVAAFGGAVTTHYNQIHQTNTFIDAFGPLKLSGYTITAQPASLRLSVGLGKGFIHGGFYKQNPTLPSVIDTTAVATASMARVYRSGSNGNIKFDTNGGAMYTVTDPSLYDNGTGILAAVGNSQWTIQRVFTDPVTNTLYVYYGQNKYNTYLNAVAAINTDPFTEGAATEEFTIFAGYIIAKGNETNLSSADSSVTQAGLFRNTSGASTGAGAATTALEQLTDVSIISPSNGQALVYNAGVWSNATASTSSFATTASAATSITFTPQSASFATTASYAPVPTGTVSSSTQINTGSFSGSFTGTLIGTASWASNAISSSFATTSSFAVSASWAPTQAMGSTAWGDLTGIPAGLVSSSTQINTGSFSGSFVGTLTGTSSWATSASYVLPSGLPAGTVSSSAQVSYTGLSNIPVNIVSSSTQVTSFLPTGTVSSSGQISYTGLSNIPVNIVSSSAQVTVFLPAGTVSSSTQINTGSFTGSFTGTLIGTSSWASNAISSSFTTTSSFATSASFAPTILPSGVVSSSGQISYTGLSNIPANIVSSSGQVSYIGLSNVPTDIVSSSTQVTAFLPAGTVSSSVQINTGSFTGSFTGTFIGTSSVATSASFAPTILPSGVVSSSGQVSYTGLSNIPVNIVSSSAQVTAFLPAGTVSSSRQINTGSFSGSITTASFATTASFTTSASFAPTILPSGVVSSSAQVSYTGLSNIPANIVSSSTQVTAFLPTGTVSSSGQVSYAGLSNIPSGIISSSNQFNALTNTSASYATRTPLGTSYDSRSITFVGNSRITDDSTGNIDIIAGSPASYAEIGSFNNENFVYVDNFGAYIQTNYTTNPTRLWTFGMDGTLTAPGLIIGTASWASNVISSSFATTASYALNATATVPAGTVSSSLQFNSLTLPFTGSFTGSFKGDGTGLTGITATAFPYTGAAVISGSLIVTGSGGVTVTGPVTITGALQATTKSFKIDHQILLGKKLIYGVLEGPEHGVYVRGRLTRNTIIHLPEEWKWLVDPISITVQLTPIGTQQVLYVQNIENNTVIINSNTPIDCFYYVQATRKDVAPLTTVE